MVGIQNRIEDLIFPLRYTVAMDSIIDKEKWRAQYRARVEAVQRVEDDELVGMTDAEALRRIKLLGTCEPPWRERPDWSGLVEQQAIFRRWYKK